MSTMWRDTLTEDEYRARKIATEIAAPLLTVLGILVGVWQFHAGARETAILQHTIVASQDSLEFRRRVWQEELETYRKLASAVGNVSSTVQGATLSKADFRTRAAFDSATRDFERLYWGVTVFVGDTLLDGRLHELHLALADAAKGSDGAAARVQVLGDSVVIAAKRSLNRGWNDLDRGWASRRYEQRSQ